MSWMEGVGPVKDVDMLGRSKGLHKDWYSNKKHKWVKSRKEIEKGSFWDIIDNPLYEVAAGAAGFDWATWVEEAKGKVGTSPDSGSTRVRATIKAGTPAGIRRVRTGRSGYSQRHVAGTPAEYEWMTKDEAEERGLSYEAASTGRWRNKETGEIHDAPVDPNRNIPTGPYGIRIGVKKDWMDDWEELRDWGILDNDVAGDLDDMGKWLSEIVNVNKHLPKIIREGPQGKHYGIEGDIWEHYGLDKELEPPKELEWDSYDKKMNLKVASRSSATYSTPEGMTPIDLHGD